MAKPVDREVTGAASGHRRPEAGDESRNEARVLRKRWPLITRISDQDYRCVWRPCHALDQEDGGGTAG